MRQLLMAVLVVSLAGAIVLSLTATPLRLDRSVPKPPLIGDLQTSRPQVTAVRYAADGESVLACGLWGGYGEMTGPHPRGWVGRVSASTGVLAGTVPEFTSVMRGIFEVPGLQEVATYGNHFERTTGAPTVYGQLIVRNRDYRPVKSFRGHSFDVNAASLNPAGTRLATASRGDLLVQGPRQPIVRSDGNIDFDAKGLAVWDFATGKLLKTINAHTKPFNQNYGGAPKWVEANCSLLAVVWTLDGKRLITGGEDGRIRVWDAETLDAITATPTRKAWSQHLALTPKGDKLVAYYGDGDIVVWDTATWKELKTDNLPRACIWDGTVNRPNLRGGVALAPDGQSFAVANGEVVQIYPIDGNAEPKPVPTTLVGPTCVAYSPDGRYLAIGFMDAVLGDKAKHVGGVEQFDLQANAPRQLVK